MSLKIIFAGTPEFAVPTLQALFNSEHQILAVYTQPDRPAGRGQQLQASPVKEIARLHNIPIFQPKTLRDENVQKEMRAFNADVMIVVAYGLILPESVLKIPRLGCINIHPSLLPRWRGAAPIPRSIEAGDLETGVTVMQLEKGMDTGAILKQENYKYIGDETSGEMHDLFSHRGAGLLLDTLYELEKKLSNPISQNNALATYTEKIQKAEAIIDWNLSAKEINNKIRAFNPWPVAHTIFLKNTLRIWIANAITEKSKYLPGILAHMNRENFWIAAGDGMLEIISVQLPGKKIISAADFINGQREYLVVGKTRFG